MPATHHDARRATKGDTECFPSPRENLRSGRKIGPLGHRYRGERGLLTCLVMKILEARFYPHSIAHDGAVVIGRVFRDEDRVFVEFADVSQRAVQPFVPQAVLKKLHFLVDAMTPDTFDLLKGFRSDFWSFVEVSSTGPERSARE